jgi:drug/metabolite transporter (DMT)-like permease
MSARNWALFAALSLLWGVPYLLIKIAVADVSPGLVAWGRVAVGAVALLPWAWRRGALRGLRHRFTSVAAYALLEVALPFPLIAWGERSASSSLSAVLVSTLPMLVALLSWRVGQSETLGRNHLAGLVAGLVGVVLLLGVDVSGSLSALLGGACVLLATVSYAGAAVIYKSRLADLDPVGPNAVALAMSTILLIPAAAGSVPLGVPSPAAVAAIVVLGLACTALALVVYAALIVGVGAGRASVPTYVNPVVASVLGAVILHEMLNISGIAGIVLILGGSWLSTRTHRKGGEVSAVSSRVRASIGSRLVLLGEDREASSRAHVPGVPERPVLPAYLAGLTRTRPWWFPLADRRRRRAG